MNWLTLIQVAWPIAVILMPLILATGFLWLKTQLATKAELKIVEGKIDGHVKRFERGSAKFSDHDKRIALVEEECASTPTKNDLNQGLSIVSGRISGLEASIKGLLTSSQTQHDYLRTLLENALKGSIK